ncbi:MAG: DUF4348 domain-containing protein [Saprospiraceae bacterium]
MKISILIFLGILFFSCGGSEKKQNQTTNASETPVWEPAVAQTTIPDGVDANFETFLSYFNKDSVFQISRIDFPFKIKENDSDYKPVERIIQKSEWRKIDFSYDESSANTEFDRYEQKNVVDGDKAVIEVRGIENGIMVDVYFEKKNGKWKLLTWVDSST